MKRRQPKLPLTDEAYDRIPRAQLTLTDETIWLSRFDPRGAPTATYPVAAHDVALAFNTFGASTGLLPEHTLFWQQCRNQLRIGMWLPPATRALVFATGRGDETLAVPLPGFVFVGAGAQYSIFAAPARPRQATDLLYHAPLPNVHPSGLICAGNVKFPRCAPDTLAQAAALFFESHFNSDLSTGKLAVPLAVRVARREDGDDYIADEEDDDDGDDYIANDTSDLNVIAFLRRLKGKKKFPQEALLRNTTLRTVLEDARGR